MIAFAPPCIDQKEISTVVRVLKSGWLTMGHVTHDFEDRFARYVGAKHAVAVNSCTSGLFLSLIVSGIKPGDEVITSPFTFAATANVVHQLGAKPVFVDIDRETFNLDPRKVATKITSRTKAIIPVHYGGQPCDLCAIDHLAKDYKLLVIEDAAHALGASYEGQKIGSRNNLTCFSFYVTKPLTTGEGGMITTSDEKLAMRLRTLRLHGISHDAWKRYDGTGHWYYELREAGFKMNTTDLNAAIGLAQLPKLDGFTARRERLFKAYNEAFADVEGVITPTVRPNVQSSYHLYPLLLKKKKRAAVIHALQQKGIATSVHFIPLHLQPFYQQAYGYRKGDFPEAEWVYEREISLPIYPQLDKKSLRHIIDSVKELVA